LRSSSGNQVKKYDISGARSIHGKDESSIHNFSRKSDGKMPFGIKWHKMDSEGFYHVQNSPLAGPQFFYQNVVFGRKDTHTFSLTDCVIHELSYK